MTGGGAQSAHMQSTLPKVEETKKKLQTQTTVQCISWTVHNTGHTISGKFIPKCVVDVCVYFLLTAIRIVVIKYVFVYLFSVAMERCFR